MASLLPLQEARVCSLVRELRSHMPHAMSYSKKKKKKSMALKKNQTVGRRDKLGGWD